MSPEDAILIGAIAGALIVFAVSLVDKIKLDDPVGAIAVHLICGVWGTLAVGVFGAKAGFDQFIIQLVGVSCYAGFCIITSFVIIYTLKKTVGIRVSEREELEGLDAHEHKMDAYPDFRLNEH
jgi:Amt family ammonium transporter